MNRWGLIGFIIWFIVGWAIITFLALNMYPPPF